MKANELQIGDLIYVYGQNGNLSSKPHWYVRKVTADWLFDMARSEEKDRYIAESGITIPAGQLSVGDTKPITLTEEILKANGWEEYNERYDIACYRVLTEKDCAVIEPMKIKSRLGDNWFWFTNGNREAEVVKPRLKYPLVYVHELQHALRLCGLNELADNFRKEVKNDR